MIPMSTDLASRLQQTLATIVEGFSDYFVAKLKEQYYPNSPEYIKVKNIKVEKKLGATGIHLVKVSLESDLGIDVKSIAVKIYDQKITALDVIKKIDHLMQSLEPYHYLGISSPGVIFFSGTILVMEGLSGEVFRQSRIPKPEKYRLAGKSLAAFHGTEENDVWIEKYQLLISKSIENLPIIEEEKEGILSNLFKRLQEIEQKHIKSGTVSFGDFHPGNVIFEVRIGQKPIIWTHVLDPEYLDKEKKHDRLEDICNFFAIECVDHYRRDKGLYRFKINLKAFISGYNEIMAIKNKNLSDFYNESPPINFFLSIMILLGMINILSMRELYPSDEDIKKETELRLTLIKYLLTEPKFPY